MQRLMRALCIFADDQPGGGDVAEHSIWRLHKEVECALKYARNMGKRAAAKHDKATFSTSEC